MEENTGKNQELMPNNDSVQAESNEAKDISRRQLLKVLAVGSAVAAVSLVPGKWKTPVVKSGVLPAHAQVTPTYVITCSGGGNIDPIDREVLELIFNATVSPIPPLNTQLIANLNTNPTQNQTGATDSNGQVFFSITVPIGNIQNNSVTATVSFVDQNTFGQDTCTATFNLVFPQ